MTDTGIDYKIDVSHKMSDDEGNGHTVVRCIATHLESGQKYSAVCPIEDVPADQAIIYLVGIAKEMVMDEAREQMAERFGLTP